MCFCAVGANKNPVTRNICFENSKGDNGKSCQRKLPLNQNLVPFFFISACYVGTDKSQYLEAERVVKRGPLFIINLDVIITKLSGGIDAKYH